MKCPIILQHNAGRVSQRVIRTNFFNKATITWCSGIRYDYISTQDVATDARLRSRYDVILFGPVDAGPVRQIVDGLPMWGNAMPWKKTALTPNLGRIDETDDVRPGLGARGVDNLKRFVADGGLLVTAGDTAELAIEIGLAPGVGIAKRDGLRLNGTLVRAQATESASPVTWGYAKPFTVYTAEGLSFTLSQQAGGRPPHSADDHRRPTGRGGPDDIDLPQTAGFGTPPELPHAERWQALPLSDEHRRNNPRVIPEALRPRALLRFADANELFFGMPIHGVPTDHFNRMFDDVVVSSEMERLARAVRRRARRVTDLSQDAIRDAVRSHAAVQRIMELHDADAITIECLMLKHRKPCLSFALNNGNLLPCGCENDLNATLTLMLGANCFGRGGFQHNPEFDTEQNLYFASHCTCTTRLHGPRGKETAYDLRPFFHQMPQTLALDVQWPRGETVTLCKYHSGKQQLDAWRGEVISSPTSPPTGGCATRTLVKIEGVTDVCSVYGGPHPVLYCGDFARHLKTLAQLYELEIRTNC